MRRGPGPGPRMAPRPAFRPAFRRRRPVVVGGGYVWNGTYWVAPNGACYTRDEDGVYHIVDCAPQPAVIFSNAEGDKKELREGGPLNKKNLRDLAIGLGIGVLAVYVIKKYKLCNCFE